MYVVKNGGKIPVVEFIKDCHKRGLEGHKARISNSYISFSQDALPNNVCYAQFFYGDIHYVKISKERKVRCDCYKISKDKPKIVIKERLRKRLNDNKIPNGLYELKKNENIEEIREGGILYEFKLIKNRI